MDISADTRAMLLDIGQTVLWHHESQPPVHVPALISDHAEGGVDGRSSRVATIRVCKEDCPQLSYRDRFVDASGTEWSVIDTNYIIDDRLAGTWRARIEADTRGQF